MRDRVTIQKKQICSPSRIRKGGTFLAFALLIACAPTVRHEAREAIRYCAEVLIGSLFPFAVLVQLLLEDTEQKGDTARSRFLCRLLRVPRAALRAIGIGIFSGFPLGGRIIADLYKKNRISQEDAQRLFPMVNNPSVAFVCVGVGEGMLGSLSRGALLYCSVIAASWVVGRVGSSRPVLEPCLTALHTEPPSLAETIRSATATTLSVCGYVVFFSVVSGVLSSLFSNTIVQGIVRIPIEVTGACRAISALSLSSMRLKTALLGFALGFGGICVGMQSEADLRLCKIPITTYYIRKIAGGALAGLLAFLLSFS